MDDKDLNSLARLSFERYKQHCEREGIPCKYSNFDDQPQTLIDSCIAQVRSIVWKLDALKMFAHPANSARHNRVLFLTDEEVEALAIQEHDRWVEERIADGWRSGSEVDADKKTTPYLVPWEELSEVEKDFDRRPIRDMIPLLEAIGYWVYRSH